MAWGGNPTSKGDSMMSKNEMIDAIEIVENELIELAIELTKVNDIIEMYKGVLLDSTIQDLEGLRATLQESIEFNDTVLQCKVDQFDNLYADWDYITY